MNKRILKEWGYAKDWPDISEIGTFEYSIFNDSDDYKEYLINNELEDSDEVRKEYFKDNVDIDLSFTDHEYYHHMGGVGDVYLDEIENEYGEELANMILNDCYNKFDSSYQGSIEKADLYADVTVDLNDDDAINRFCSKYLPTSTEYHKGDRGFILSNGVIVYTEGEHNEILAIPGLESKFQFIKMGNIRIMPNSIDIGQCPTFAQVRMLRNIINCYANDELYIDLEGHPRAGNAGCRYDYPDDDEVIADIYRYYQDGIKPTGGHGHMRNNMYENNNKRKMNKIRITESQLHNIIKESVKKILSEVKVGGESLHGNNPEDWYAMSTLRQAKGIYDAENDIDDNDKYITQGSRDSRNAASLLTNLPSNGMSRTLAMNGIKSKGQKKGDRIAHTVGYLPQDKKLYRRRIS